MTEDDIIRMAREARLAEPYHPFNPWGAQQEKRDASIIIIRNGLANLPLVGIPEISLAATLVELTT